MNSTASKANIPSLSADRAPSVVETASLIAARFVAYTALLLTAGVPLYAVTAGPFVPMTRPRRIALALLALLAAAASIWWALETVAAMAGLTLATLDRETFTVVLAATPLGTVMEWRLTALAAVFLAMIVPLRALRSAVAGIAGVIALATMAWTGHAGASESDAGRLADVIHLVAAATWLGALAWFTAACFGDNEQARTQSLAAFARTGSVIVALLLLTGLINTIMIAGWPLAVGSAWFWWLVLKIALFAAMLGLAAINRWKITPALGRGEPSAPVHLKRSLVLELALGLGVVAIVAMLGVLDPAA